MISAKKSTLPAGVLDPAKASPIEESLAASFACHVMSLISFLKSKYPVTLHANAATLSAKYGTPCANWDLTVSFVSRGCTPSPWGDVVPVLSYGSIPGVAKALAIACCVSERTEMMKCADGGVSTSGLLETSASARRLGVRRLNATNGGSSETDVNDDNVAPWTNCELFPCLVLLSAISVVTIATGWAEARMILRRSSAMLSSFVFERWAGALDKLLLEEQIEIFPEVLSILACRAQSGNEEDLAFRETSELGAWVEEG
jgi:hypothetical protein